MFGVKEQRPFWVFINLYLLASIQPLTQAMIPKDPVHDMVSSTSPESGWTFLTAMLASLPKPEHEREDPWGEHLSEESDFNQKVDRPKRNILDLATTGHENHIANGNSKKAKLLAEDSRDSDIFHARSISSVAGPSSDLDNHPTQDLYHLEMEGQMSRISGDSETQNHGYEMTPNHLHSFPVGSHNMHIVDPDSLNNLRHDHDTEHNSDIDPPFDSYQLLENPQFSFISKDAFGQNWEPASAKLEKDLTTFKNHHENNSPRIENSQLEHRMSDEDISKSPTLKPQPDHDFYSDFQAHKPSKFHASLAAHLTSRLVQRIFRSLRPLIPEGQLSKFGQVWNSETVLPFVYFQMLANPSLEMWTRVETIMAILCRGYHQNYPPYEGTIDSETLAKFLVWHSGIFQQMTDPIIPLELSNQDDLKLYRFRTQKGLHSLARIFSSLHRKDAWKSYFTEAKWEARDIFAQKHLSSTWMEDFEKGYPNKPHSEEVVEGVWENWIAKSSEIASTIEHPWFREQLAIYSKEKSARSIELLNRGIENQKTRASSTYPRQVQNLSTLLMSPYPIKQNLQNHPYNFFTRAFVYFFEHYIDEKKSDLWGVTRDDTHMRLLATFFRLMHSESDSDTFWKSFKGYLKTIPKSKKSI